MRRSARTRSSSRPAEPGDTSSPGSRWPTSSCVATPRHASSSRARPRGLETRLVPKAGYSLELLPILPLNAISLVRTAKGVAALPWGMARAAALVRRLRPAAVLGIGGYAGGPVTLLAALLGVKTIVLEPNAKPGFTNRVAEAVRGEGRVRVRGGSRRLRREGCPHRQPGARRLRLAAEAGPPSAADACSSSAAARARACSTRRSWPRCRTCRASTRLRIVHQTGPAMHEATVTAYRAAGREAEVPPLPRRHAGAPLRRGRPRRLRAAAPRPSRS